MSSEIDADDFRAIADEFERKFETWGLEFERSKEFDISKGDEYDSFIYQFIESATTDFYLGLHSDNVFGEFIWEYNLVADIKQQMDQKQADKILPASDLPSEPQEDTQNVKQMFLSLIKAGEEGNLKEEIQGSSLESELENKGEKQLISDLKESFHKICAAEKALDEHVNINQTEEIHMNLEGIFKNGPFDFDIELSEKNGLRGFKLKYRIFPYDQLPEQKLFEIYSSIWNHALYTERFLRFTFNITDEDELEWNKSLNGDQSSGLL